MSYDSARTQETGSIGGGAGAGAAPGKRSQTDRLTAPTGATGTTAAASTSALSGTAWLDGLLGFTGTHEPSGECCCAGCVSGRVSAQGFNGPEDAPLNEVKSESGGGGDDAGAPPPVAAEEAEVSAAAPAAPAAPAEAGAPGAQPAAAPQKEPGKPGQAAQPGKPGQPAPEAQPGEQKADAQEVDPSKKKSSGEESGEPGKQPPKVPKPLAIKSETRKKAPGGAPKTRTTVGPGEVVDFTGSEAGTWTATAGTPVSGASGKAFAWTAPEAAGAVTITLTAGTQTATKEITVVAPSSLSMVVSSQHGLTAGTAGVCMVTNVTVGPTTVSFGNTEWLEVPGPATGVSGYFKQFKAATLFHNPNPNWLQWNDKNTGLTDHAAWHSVPPPYSAGAFQWSIPNKYRVAGSSSSGVEFTTTTQLFQMTDAAGTMSVSKAGASATRTP